jgi:hypothetical protein
MLKLFNFHSSDQKNRLFQAKLSVLTKYFGEKTRFLSFRVRLIGRANAIRPYTKTEEIQPAEAGFVCVDAVSTARSSLIVFNRQEYSRVMLFARAFCFPLDPKREIELLRSLHR